MRRTQPATRKQLLLFAGNFLRHPKMLGSVVPSSRHLAGRVLGHIDWASARVVVEYGPGVGNMTREILRRLHPDARLVVFETNTRFVHFLREGIADPRLTIVPDSAEQVAEALRGLGIERTDAVVCGIPLTLLSARVRDRILRATQAVLGAGGTLLVYQFSPAILPHLKRVFPRVSWRPVLRNIPPALVFCCRDTAAAGNGRAAGNGQVGGNGRAAGPEA